jgi:O-antigen ligase
LHHSIIRTFARIIELLEPALFVGMALAFWTPDPRRVWALALLIPILGSRWILHRRLWTPTALDRVWAAFLTVCALNVLAATLSGDGTLPLTRGWVMLGRPLFGMMLALALVEAIRQRGDARIGIWLLVGIGGLIAALAVGASSWSEKSILFTPITSALPRIPRNDLTLGGFNVNEIGGALTFVLPILAAVSISGDRRGLRGLAGGLFWIGMAALVLGQSRMAIFGVIAGLTLVAWTLIRARGWRWLALGGLALLTAFELALVGGLFGSDEVGISERDESSWGARILIWESAAAIIADHPLTGAGLNMFRDGRVRALYPVAGYEQQVLPHAHNAWLQIGTDMGIVGIALMLAWQGVTVWLLWRLWRVGGDQARLIAVGCGGGLLAHAIFGLADAIPLWDRFAFLGYLVTGLALGQHWLITSWQQDRAILKQDQEKALVAWQSKTSITSSDG